MSSKPFPSDILTQARSVVKAWKKIDPALSIGELDPAALMADVQQVAPIQTDIDALDAQLTDLHNQRDPEGHRDDVRSLPHFGISLSESAPESKASTATTLHNMR